MGWIGVDRQWGFQMGWAPCGTFELLSRPQPRPHKLSPAQCVPLLKMKEHVQIRSWSGVAVRRCARAVQWDGRLDLGKVRDSPSALLSTTLPAFTLMFRTSSLGLYSHPIYALDLQKCHIWSRKLYKNLMIKRKAK